MLEHEDLSGRIIGAAIEVHRALGPGFLERIYEEALVIELRERGIGHQRQLPVSVRYAGRGVGHHELDLFVEGQIVVELKAVKSLEDAHFAVVKSYLRAVGRRHGLILNFAKPVLEIRRVISERGPEGGSGSWVPSFLVSSASPEGPGRSSSDPEAK